MISMESIQIISNNKFYKKCIFSIIPILILQNSCGKSCLQVFIWTTLLEGALVTSLFNLEIPKVVRPFIEFR